LRVYDNSTSGNATADSTYDNYFAAAHEPPPVISSIHNIAKNGTVANAIGVRFDRIVTLPSATNPANYVVNAGTVNVADVHLRPDGRSVEVIAGDSVGEFFSVCAVNVQGAGNTSAPTIATGYTSEYSSVTIGTAADPQQPGQVYTSFWDTFDVTVGGSGFGDAISDHFHFIYQPVIGDFDTRVLLTRLDFVDPLSQAGLMARETPAFDSASVQTYVTSGPVGNQIQDTLRPASASTAISFASTPLPSGAPLPWLRLTRTNDTFTAYYATNGEDWIVSGQTDLPLNAFLNVGMAVASHNDATNTTASFTDFYHQGGRPGDEIRPTLSALHVGTNIVLKWPQTPRSYALEVAAGLGGTNEWSLLMLPVGFNGSTRAFQANVPIGLLGQKLFVRNTRVDKLIPDIPAIMVTTGMILSPGAGLVTNASNGTLNGFGVVSNSVVASTNTVTWLNVGSTNLIDTEQSSSSSGATQLDTVLFVRNVTAVPLNSTNDNDSAIYGETRSKMLPLPAPLGATTKFTFTAAAKTNSTFTTVVRIHLGP